MPHTTRTSTPLKQRIVVVTIMLLLISGIATRRSFGSSSPSKLVASALSISRLAPKQTALTTTTTTTTARAMSSAQSSDSAEFFTIGLTGSSGLVGTAIRDELNRQGNVVNGKPVQLIRLTRGDSAQEIDDSSSREMTLQWNPRGATANDILHPTAVEAMDAIVHLSGESVATGLGPLGFLGIRPWTEAKKQEILDSRTVTTKALAKALGELATTQPKSFLVASGIGAYGDHFIGKDSPEAADESANIESTTGFLAEVSRQWEAASKITAEEGAVKHRVVNMRFGVLLSTKGGALAKLYPIFFTGGGGNVGSGEQYFPFISARDHARAVLHTLQTPSLQGPVNLCAPQPCTNAEFTAALGKGMGRPTLLPFPGFAVNLLFGEMGREMLLGGVRAKPTKLEQSGFQFQHPTIQQAIDSALSETI